MSAGTSGDVDAVAGGDAVTDGDADALPLAGGDVVAGAGAPGDGGVTTRITWPLVVSVRLPCAKSTRLPPATAWGSVVGKPSAPAW